MFFVFTNFTSVDVLTAVGKKNSQVTETIKFFRLLEESRKGNLNSLVNCTLLEMENIADVLDETPDQLAISFQFFLQGIGRYNLCFRDVFTPVEKYR